MDSITFLIEKHRDKIVQLRRDLHRIPEPAYTESKTSAYVADYLGQLGLDVKTGIAKFGVLGAQTFEEPGENVDAEK